MSSPLCRFRFRKEDGEAWCECGQWKAFVGTGADRSAWKYYWQTQHVVADAALPEPVYTVAEFKQVTAWRVLRNGVPIGLWYPSRRQALAAICGIKKYKPVDNRRSKS